MLLVCAAVVSCLAARDVRAQSPAQGAAPEVTLTIGREPDNSLVAQVSVAVVTEAFRRAGIGLLFARLPLQRLADVANSGEVDGDLNRIAQVVGKYPNLMLVPTPINRVDVAVYATTAAVANESRAELRKRSVVIQRGIFVLGKYSEGMHVTDTSSLDSAMEMLLNGRGDILMLVYADAEAWLARRKVNPGTAGLPYAGVVRWPHAWAQEPLYLLLNRKHAALVPRLNSALLEMQKEGLIEREYREGFRRARLPVLEPEPAATAAAPRGRG